MTSHSKTIVPWTDGERSRLWKTRQEHSHLNWTEFHEMNLFPERSRISLYAEYRRMDKLDTQKRLRDSGDKPDGSKAVTVLKIPKRARDITLDPTKNRLQKKPKVDENNEAKDESDDDEEEEEESNDEDGDINNNGETMPLQSPQTMRRSQALASSPVKCQPLSKRLPSSEPRHQASDTSTGPPQMLVHPLPDRPVIANHTEEPIVLSESEMPEPGPRDMTQSKALLPREGNHADTDSSAKAPTAKKVIQTSSDDLQPRAVKDAPSLSKITPSTADQIQPTSSHMVSLSSERQNQSPKSPSPSPASPAAPAARPQQLQQPQQPQTQQPKQPQPKKCDVAPIPKTTPSSAETLTETQCLQGVLQLIGRFSYIQSEKKQACIQDTEPVSALTHRIEQLESQLADQNNIMEEFKAQLDASRSMVKVGLVGYEEKMQDLLRERDVDRANVADQNDVIKRLKAELKVQLGGYEEKFQDLLRERDADRAKVAELEVYTNRFKMVFGTGPNECLNGEVGLK